ncbi:hypothetical protein E2C01_051539 [Portunus trituberculatus]|uniref:Uncharacterized protein n=1 Tax=Portunus trituberculatus TaxID=210409 RepID=A0A5B7GJ00_PORTR|nr:hypothetical protein [Portunus trituberculatus]
MLQASGFASSWCIGPNHIFCHCSAVPAARRSTTPSIPADQPQGALAVVVLTPTANRTPRASDNTVSNAADLRLLPL